MTGNHSKDQVSKGAYININSFLKFRYFLDYNNPDFRFDLSHVDKQRYAHCTEDELVDLGIEKLRDVIARQFEPGQKHVVPLSGGLDSRAILAALLEFTDAENIHTYTFGTPGTQDYEIGTYLATITGTDQTCFPLTEYRYSMDELLDISRRMDHQTVLFHHPPVWELDKRYVDFVVWSGFMGDSLAGYYTPGSSAGDLNKAKKEFIVKNIYVRSIDLSDCKDDELFDLIECDCIEKERVALAVQLDLQNRKVKYLYPHVLLRGFNYKTPFIDSEWVDFMLSIDDKYRKGQYLYKKILIKAFPELFSVGTTANYGVPLGANKIKVFFKKASIASMRAVNKFKYIFPERRLNYINFEEAIRNREDLRTIVYENIMDLKKRKIVDWIDIDAIWRRHTGRRVDHADALLVLASLEIHIKARGMGRLK